jgi:hypothetical protein
MRKLTNTEAEVIYALHRENGVQVGETFVAEDEFPGQGKHAIALRAVVVRLVERNVLDSEKPGLFVMTRAALKAYDAWAKREPVRYKISLAEGAA